MRLMAPRPPTIPSRMHCLAHPNTVSRSNSISGAGLASLPPISSWPRPLPWAWSRRNATVSFCEEAPPSTLYPEQARTASSYSIKFVS